jgi:hypothetical protein
MQPIANDDQRIDFRIPVDLLLNKYINGRPYLARASNISRRGLLLHRVLEPGAQQDRTVGLQFVLPGSDRVITCAGRVVYKHSSMAAHGVEFTHVDPEHQQLIDDFILDNLDWP